MTAFKQDAHNLIIAPPREGSCQERPETGRSHLLMKGDQTLRQSGEGGTAFDWDGTACIGGQMLLPARLEFA